MDILKKCALRRNIKLEYIMLCVYGAKTIKAGKMYTITVTGDYNNDGRVRAWISAETDINPDELGGKW